MHGKKTAGWRRYISMVTITYNNEFFNLAPWVLSVDCQRGVSLIRAAPVLRRDVMRVKFRQKGELMNRLIYRLQYYIYRGSLSSSFSPSLIPFRIFLGSAVFFSHLPHYSPRLCVRVRVSTYGASHCVNGTCVLLTPQAPSLCVCVYICVSRGHVCRHYVCAHTITVRVCVCA